MITYVLLDGREREREIERRDGRERERKRERRGRDRDREEREIVRCAIVLNDGLLRKCCRPPQLRI